MMEFVEVTFPTHSPLPVVLLRSPLHSSILKSKMAGDSKRRPLLPQSVAQEEASNQTSKRKFWRCQTVPSAASFQSQGTPALSDPTPKSLFAGVRPSFKWVSLVLAIYLGIGSICFFVINNQIGGEKTNGIIDALYFCIVTMTTVGYGDLVPSSSLAKILACTYVFCGMAVVGFILSKAADHLVEKQELLVVKALYGSCDTGDEALFRVAEISRAKYKFIMTGIILLSLLIIGTIFLYKVEKLDFIDALYCVCSTITTLGYGDKSFSTVGGRVFAIVWILAGTICLAQFYLYLAETYTERKQQVLANIVLKRRLTFLDLKSADLDCDGSVGAAEFVVYKLKEMGKISQDDIAPILEQFQVLDRDKSGTLTPEDITCRSFR